MARGPDGALVTSYHLHPSSIVRIVGLVMGALFLGFNRKGGIRGQQANLNKQLE